MPQKYLVLMTCVLIYSFGATHCFPRTNIHKLSWKCTDYSEQNPGPKPRPALLHIKFKETALIARPHASVQILKISECSPFLSRKEIINEFWEERGRRSFRRERNGVENFISYPPLSWKMGEERLGSGGRDINIRKF